MFTNIDETLLTFKARAYLHVIVTVDDNIVALALNLLTVSIPVAALGVTARWKMRTLNSMWIVLHLILQNLIYCHLLKLSHINLVLKFLVLSFSHSLYECRTPETKFISEWFELLKNYLPTNTLTTTNKAKYFMFKSSKLSVKMWNCYRNIDVPKGIHHIGQNGVNFAMWPNAGLVYDCDRVLTYKLYGTCCQLCGYGLLTSDKQKQVEDPQSAYIVH